MSWPHLEFQSPDSAFFFYGSAVLSAYVAAALTASIPPGPPTDSRTAAQGYTWRAVPVASAASASERRRFPAPDQATVAASGGMERVHATAGTCVVGQAPADPALPPDPRACEDALHTASLAGHD